MFGRVNGKKRYPKGNEKKRKRYFFRGREISRARANAMVIGAVAGMVGAGFGLWIFTIFLTALLNAAGGAA